MKPVPATLGATQLMVSANLPQLLADALPPHTPPASSKDFALTVLLQEADAGRMTPHPSVTALLECLRKDPALEMFHGRTQIFRDVGKGVTHVFLAELLGRAGAVGANQAVKDLERYLGTERLPCHSTVAVGGIKVDGANDLGHGMHLVPWKDVRNSRTKRAVDQAETFHRSFYDPDCALLREVELPRVHVHYTDSRFHLQSRDVTTETDLLLLCLGLLGPTAPVLVASWLEPPEWAPMITGSLSMPFVEGPGKAKQISETAVADGSRLFTSWLGLSEERRLELRVPMQRLNSAMRRPSLVDSAIDLGIALESIFLADGRGALPFRLRVRAARWLGSTPEERRRLSATVGDLYAVRSKAVHEGRVPEAIHQRTTRELLDEGYELTARALVALISKGDPDWDAVTYG